MYMCLMHSRVVRNAPSRWTASSVFHSASESASIGRTSWIPAFATRMSTRSKADTVFATPASTSFSLVTSMRSPSARAPFARRTPARSVAPLPSRSAIVTAAPAAAKVSAMCFPIPLAAPVTSAALPSSLMLCSSCRRCAVEPLARVAACRSENVPLDDRHQDRDQERKERHHERDPSDDDAVRVALLQLAAVRLGPLVGGRSIGVRICGGRHGSSSMGWRRIGVASSPSAEAETLEREALPATRVPRAPALESPTATAQRAHPRRDGMGQDNRSLGRCGSKQPLEFVIRYEIAPP